jgi:mannose-1-phosphate guanylyltransferase/phosphomannomutase
MKKEIELMGYSLSGYWRDVGNPESYREVYEDILNHSVKFNISGHKKEYPDGVLYSSVEYTLDPSVEIIGTVVLDENVTLEKGVKLNNVVIGKNVTIGQESKIRNSIFWEDIVVEKNAKFDNCLICNNNVINKNVTAKAGLILAQGCDVGELASFEQDVIIWPDKKIEAAAIVSHSLILGSKYKNSIFENGSVSGKSNIELSCEMATKLAEAFASQLPIGSKVIVGRDNDKSSRMLKRAFLGGLLSAGVNVVDIKSVPPSVLRYTLANDGSLVGGAHFKRAINDSVSSEITLFNEEALRVDNNSSNKIEKAFFTENFRRVDYADIGSIHETMHHMECTTYKEALEHKIDHGIIKCGGFKVAVDLMHGTTAEIFPQILNHLGVENIVLNAYYDEKKLSNVSALEKNSEANISSIVQSLNYDMGLIVYPNAQRISLVDEQGGVLDKIKALNCVLALLNLEKTETRQRVFLPTWAPDIKEFDNLDIERGKYSNFTAQQLNSYDLIATVDGNFSFTEFGYTRDAIYASLKIMELLSCHSVKVSELVSSIDDFYYSTFKIECSQALKGKMMRKFLEDAKDKKSSSADGVKIWENDNDWILMIPDQYSEHLNIYIQASDDAAGEALYAKYSKKIVTWSDE